MVGRSQAVRQRILIPPCEGSIPSAPAKLYQELSRVCGWAVSSLAARLPGDSGRTYWKRHIEQASVRYTLETGFLRLTYAMRGTGRVIVERLPITTTATRFAGRRHWFSCPDCSRRCRILYGADRFRCRECLGARYESQYQNEAMNISSRRWRLRQLLEERGGAPWPGDLDDGFPPKPPKMRWKTYRRLLAQDRQFAARWNTWIQDWLHRTDPRVKQADAFRQFLEKETAPAQHFDHNSGAFSNDRPA